MKKIKVLVVGLGNMGISHTRAYQSIEGFEIVGLCSRGIESREDLKQEFPGIAQFSSYEEALRVAKPDAVSINTWPDTHAAYAKMAFKADCHVFIEKPLAGTVEEAREIAAMAKKSGLKLVIGYILRVHPSWIKFVEVGKTLGKPLVMRMNLNQQSSGAQWEVHKHLMNSISPIVDWTKVIGSDRVHGVSPRVKAIFVLVAVRSYRAYKMINLLLSHKKVVWNRRTFIIT